MTKSINQKSIARRAGIHESALSMIINRKRRATPEVAAKLEEATGVDRRAWMYPDEFENPYITSSAIK